MKKTILMIEGRREGYAPDQIRETMTVGQLIRFLEDFDEDMEVMLDNDRGYTYGSVTWDSFEEKEFEDDKEDDWDEDEEENEEDD